MDSLNATLHQQAIGLGLCQQWSREWRDYDDRELCERFKKGMDFCIKNDFPSLDFIRENFKISLLANFGVFVDQLPYSEEETLSNGTYVCLGRCCGTMRFGRWSAAVVYVRHESDIEIIADEFSRIQVKVYDNADVRVYSHDSAKVRVYDRR